jgi:hypothetical protein
VGVEKRDAKEEVGVDSRDRDWDSRAATVSRTERRSGRDGLVAVKGEEAE